MTNFVTPVSAKQWKRNDVSSKSETAYAKASLLYNDETNTIPATTTTKKVSGICQTEKAVGTADTSNVAYFSPRDSEAPFYMDVGTGSIAKTDEGKSFDLASATTVDASSSTYSPVTLYKFISTTKGQWILNNERGVNA